MTLFSCPFQPYEIVAELTVVPPQPPAAAQGTSEGSGSDEGGQEPYVLHLRQRISPKVLKNILEVSLGSFPHDSLYPEQQWSSGVKTSVFLFV